MKKTAPKKLALDTNTLRALTSVQLAAVAGAYAGTTSCQNTCGATCHCPVI